MRQIPWIEVAPVFPPGSRITCPFRPRARIYPPVLPVIPEAVPLQFGKPLFVCSRRIGPGLSPSPFNYLKDTTNIFIFPFLISSFPPKPVLFFVLGKLKRGGPKRVLPFFTCIKSADQYIPSIPPPIPGGIPCACPPFSFSGFSTTRVSVVSTMAAMLAAFCRAERVTLTGSTIPDLIMST